MDRALKSLRTSTKVNSKRILHQIALNYYQLIVQKKVGRILQNILAKKVSSARRHTNHKAEEKCFREANPEEKKKEKEKKTVTLHATVKGYESGTNTKFGAKNCFKSHYLGYSNVASRNMSRFATCFAFAPHQSSQSQFLEQNSVSTCDSCTKL